MVMPNSDLGQSVSINIHVDHGHAESKKYRGRRRESK